MKIIFDYNRTLFDPETDTLYPGVFELLGRLSKKYELALVSRNEGGRQKMFEKLGIEEYFSNVRFVENKTPELFRDLIGNSKKVFVVGDLIRDEIKIGNMLGCTTIRIQQGKFADHEPASTLEQANYTIENISELENILSKYEN